MTLEKIPLLALLILIAKIKINRCKILKFWKLNVKVLDFQQ